ncbi:DEAD/DEAH box helicase [Microbacterium sp. MPKO10]|uniref:DEAD/DEAH box helicase n=1 Tax=Microbacterium sp. MPKO10 TaxID=2989818 RepID=UPI002236034C|nr:DEAD/DEAH box helicase [Microbacterium sp. MPKO10]MCW4458755.1 DEAD/DEAH box helicase [Microbacterium sp. MPKO10]
MSQITFSALGVPAPLVSILAKDGKTDAFPIQVDTLPDTLGGRDVLGRGRTGSGKTLAFSIPMVARLGTELAGGKRRAGRPLGLVLAPTRELATQIDAVLAPLAAAYGMKTTTIYGGINQRRQVEALNAGVDIVVACPGRLEDLMNQGHVRLDAVEITVLDEADHMADLGFLPVVTRILAATPANGQRMLFSATLDNGVDKIVKRFLHNPVTHSVDDETSPVEAMTHHVFFVNDADAKKELVEKLASGLGRRILFTRTKHHAKKLARQLTASGIPSVDLHGNLSQPQRDRNLAAFSDGSARVLVATDVAARGVHVDNVELVVHVDPPIEHKAYLHRSGRTARAGSAGTVATVCLPVQRDDLKKLLRKAAITVTPQTVTATSPTVVELVGEEAPYVKPVAKPVQQQGGGKSQGANARRKRANRQGGQDAGQRGQRGQGGQRSSGRGERDDAPRRDRSGRPAAAGAGRSGQTRSGGRPGQQRSGQGRSGQRGAGQGRTSAPSVYSTSSSGAPRTERTHRRVSSR